MKKIDNGATGFFIGSIIAYFIGVFIEGYLTSRYKYVNTNEYKVETKTEVVNSDTTQYIRIIRK